MNFLLSIISIIFLDVATKNMCGSFFENEVYSPLLGGWVGIYCTSNSGIAFSLPLERTILIFLTIFFIGAILLYFLFLEKKKTPLMFVAIGALLGGAISNGYERIMYGFVTDWIFVKHFSIMNIADIAIVCGALLYVKELFNK